MLTETQYRHFSGDSRSPWATTGDQVGVEGLLPIVEERVGLFLSTFVQPTLVEDEEHGLNPLRTVTMGQVREIRYQIDLDKVRLLTGTQYPITARFVDRAEVEYTATACIVKKKIARLDIQPAAWTGTVTRKVVIDYWAGFVPPLPSNMLLAAAKFARILAREFIAKRGDVMEDDYPHDAPVLAMSSLGLSRSFQTPKTGSLFGASAEAVWVELMLVPYVVARGRVRGMK